MTSPHSGASGADDGNTRSSSVSEVKRVNPAKYWCFTFNNYPENFEELMVQPLRVHAKKWVFQQETGESGTPHLQGFVEFSKRVRPKNMFPRSIHWEKCRDITASIKYCSDPEKRDDTGELFTNMLLPEPLRLLPISNFHRWQRQIWDHVDTQPDDRAVDWVWESKGNVGKSALAKRLMHDKHALIVSGKGSDIMFMVKTFYENNNNCGPKIIIYDIPRSNLQYVSWACLENLKNGLILSPKYESVSLLINPPHILCFANEPPDFSKLSTDRWRVSQIMDGELVVDGFAGRPLGLGTR